MGFGTLPAIAFPTNTATIAVKVGNKTGSFPILTDQLPVFLCQFKPSVYFL